MSETGKGLEQLGITLPARDRKGKGVMDAVQVGDLSFISAHFLTDADDKAIYTGRVSADTDKETAYQAARLCGLNIPTAIKDYTGGLDQVDYVVEALGLVDSTGDFSEQPAVTNGFSDLIVEVFGKRGQHVGPATGACILEQNMPATAEAVVRIRR